MDVFEAIETRRSVKHYDPSHEMPEADLARLLDLARLSPTSFNIQHWRFVALRDPEVKKAARAAAWDQSQVEEASVTIALCADVKAWDDDPARYWRDAPEPARDALVPMIPKFHEGNEQLQRDEAIRSGGMAAQTLMLAARGLGYDSCPMIGFDPQKMGEIINLPPDHVIVMLIAIGKAAQPAWPRPGSISKEEAVFVDRFPA